MKAPTHLSHKPIIAVNDYDKIDAVYANSTDVRALSIGKAQYDNDDLSVKVWRHTGEKWSRQSEEMPLHRALDLSILIVGSLKIDTKSNYPSTILREEIVSEGDVALIKEYYEEHISVLKPRLLELRDILNSFFDKTH